MLSSACDAFESDVASEDHSTRPEDWRLLAQFDFIGTIPFLYDVILKKDLAAGRLDRVVVLTQFD